MDWATRPAENARVEESVISIAGYANALLVSLERTASTKQKAGNYFFDCAKSDIWVL